SSPYPPTFLPYTTLFRSLSGRSEVARPCSSSRFLVQCFLHAGLRFALVDDLVPRRIIERACDRVPSKDVQIELLPAFASHEFLRRREHGATISLAAERRVDCDLVQPPASRNVQQTNRWRSHPDPAHLPVRLVDRPVDPVPFRRSRSGQERFDGM